MFDDGGVFYYHVTYAYSYVMDTRVIYGCSQALELANGGGDGGMDRTIFFFINIVNMGIPILVRWHIHIEMAPRGLIQFKDAALPV